MPKILTSPTKNAREVVNPILIALSRAVPNRLEHSMIGWIQPAQITACLVLDIVWSSSQ